ncbi:SprT family zinc-dependent metalloprotease [uncultured Paraglaciecola sp.]|uniref:SprT family zinc-dependent metalloprotease n=1 Tax=uncultured Paraglaciecola sp. TaxID=1765024 RepID=UPI00261236CE|nr:SprT family zinc-dependent metalloprotease [uncultured Paraglaciecola sp.]
MLLAPQQLVIDKVACCIARASRYFKQDFDVPEISFNQRGKIAGCARLQTNELRFNPVLLADNTSVFLEEVVPHEVCHLLAFQIYGKVKPHGKEWQALMIELFQLEPKTYHKMDVHKVAGEMFRYQCQCGPVDLSLRRHNKVIKGKQQYICRQCKTTLLLDSNHHLLLSTT